MTSKSNWNPWELFRESPEELKVVEKRQQMRAAMRAEWMKKQTSPYYGLTGYMYNPTLQRIISAKVTRYDHFKRQGKANAYFFLGCVFPIIGIAYWVYKSQQDFHEKLDSGALATENRLVKYIW